MKSSRLIRSALTAAMALVSACGPTAPQTSPVPSASPKWPDRAVRRDLPMPPSFRKGYAMGTRDSSGAPGKRYWSQKVDYRIDAKVDPATNQVSGSEVITLHNTTPDTLKTIVIRLYQNYFTSRVERNDYVTDITDGVTMERLSVNGAAISFSDRKQYDLEARLATITPPVPILPGATASIEAAWRFTVPVVDTTIRGERMGRFGNYLYQVAQWYPQVAMYDELRGWDVDQYLGNAEFNNQFGSFDVKITAPGGWLLGATGDLQNPSEVYSQRTRDRLAMAMHEDTTIHVVEANERGASATASGRTLTWHFKAPLVNDFAFALSRDYVLDATHATIPGKGVIPVNVLYLPQHTNYRKNNTAQYGRQALEAHSRFLFPYEFSQGTIADGPETGMEYPMIIFNGSSQSVTIHEFGHQWFPMTVGSNETRYGWMDEGFNNYIDAYASAAINKTALNINNGSGYRRIAGTEYEAPMMWLADWAGPGSGIQAYSKAGVALNALGGIVGDSAVARAFAEYAKSWKYKHPTPYDFFFSMSHSLGKNLDWFWYQWFFTTNTFDQSIDSVKTAGDSVTLTVVDKADMPMPIIVRFDFADGFTIVNLPAEVWFSGERSRTFSWPLRGKTLKSITLDPDNRFQDLDTSNNIWPRK